MPCLNTLYKLCNLRIKPWCHHQFLRHFYHFRTAVIAAVLFFEKYFHLIRLIIPKQHHTAFPIHFDGMPEHPQTAGHKRCQGSAFELHVKSGIIIIGYGPLSFSENFIPLRNRSAYQPLHLFYLPAGIMQSPVAQIQHMAAKIS